MICTIKRIFPGSDLYLIDPSRNIISTDTGIDHLDDLDRDLCGVWKI